MKNIIDSDVEGQKNITAPPIGVGCVARPCMNLDGGVPGGASNGGGGADDTMDTGSRWIPRTTEGANGRRGIGSVRIVPLSQ